MHGSYECAGNVQELCAVKHLDQTHWWSYVKCQNFYGRDAVGTPEIALKCANAARFDWIESGVGKCAGVDGLGRGDEGIALLKESVANSAELGIRLVLPVVVRKWLNSLEYYIVKAAPSLLMESKCVFMMKHGRNVM